MVFQTLRDGLMDILMVILMLMGFEMAGERVLY